MIHRDLNYELQQMQPDQLLKEDSLKGLSSLSLSRKEDKVLVSQLDHTLQLYSLDSIEKSPPSIFKGHKSSLYVRGGLSPCSEYLFTGSADRSIYIWDRKNQESPIAKLEGGHAGEVNLLK